VMWSFEGQWFCEFDTQWLCVVVFWGAGVLWV